MKKLLPLLAALAVVGCAEEAAPVDTSVVDPPAEVVTEPADDVVVDDAPMTAPPLPDDTTEAGMMEGEMTGDTTPDM